MNLTTPSLSIKNVIMSVAALYAIGLSVFLIYNTLRITKPINSYGTIAAMNNSNAAETGVKTFCESDSECWCRMFDGTKFVEGRGPSKCNLDTGKCVKCQYE